MKQRFLYIPILLLLLLSFVDCAKKGHPSGGSKDTIPPVIVKSSPPNYSTHFGGDEIEIRFDEYIKLKDLQKELVISPPMKYAPIITPLGVAKSLKIKIVDTLKPNTTYSINMGKSIVDNNEGNEFEYFKYVFSTGSYIDSLKVTGKVRDARLVAPEYPVAVMLYEWNENFTDSLIYSEKPTYITMTKDTTGFFELSNLKEGKYLLMALQEKNSDYIFQPQTDKIAFAAEPISIPSDSSYVLTLFKEKPAYKLSRPVQMGNNHIGFGYTGKVDSLQIAILSETPSDFESIRFKDEKKDTLHYWFKPSFQADSLVFKVTHAKNVDTVQVRMKKKPRDSMQISAVNAGVVRLKDTFKLRSTTPLVALDPDRFQIIAQDSSAVAPSIDLNTTYNWVRIFFPKNEEEKYFITLMPGAVTDFYGAVNDTLKYAVTTKMASDYGTLSLTLQNVPHTPLIVQLVDPKYKVVAEEIISGSEEENSAEIFFDEIRPEKYFIRIIYDSNNNGKWDTGSFLQRHLPEKIVYYPQQIEVRANWSLNEIFILK